MFEISYLHEKQLIPEARVVFGWVLFLVGWGRGQTVNSLYFLHHTMACTSLNN